MTDLEFQILRHDIHQLMFKLEDLQKKHIAEAGRRYVVSEPWLEENVPEERENQS